MSKNTRLQYFLAALAQDLWAHNGHLNSNDACEDSGARLDLFEELWSIAEEIRGREYLQKDGQFMDVQDVAFLAAQLGCEKAGL
jgi:hypothetical protein